MKLLLIRHGAPNYEKDCLTDLGREQARLLAERLVKEDIAAVYSSPMGRARETAAFYAERSGHSVRVLDWLHEFDAAITDTTTGEKVITWDIRPKVWTESKLLFDKDSFGEAAELAGSDMYPRYRAVQEGVDSLLSEYGLVREGGAYRKAPGSDKTIALFCHFGASCVVIAHLLGIAPMVTLQGFSAEPTAIATLCTDDRFEDVVNFRLHGFGDIAHLGANAANSGVNYK